MKELKELSSSLGLNVIINTKSHFTSIQFRDNDEFLIISLILTEPQRINLCRFTEIYKTKDFKCSDNYSYVQSVSIDRSYRGNGLYSKVLNASLPYIKSIGSKGLISTVIDPNGNHKRVIQATKTWEKMFTNQHNISMLDDKENDGTIFIMT